MTSEPSEIAKKEAKHYEEMRAWAIRNQRPMFDPAKFFQSAIDDATAELTVKYRASLERIEAHHIERIAELERALGTLERKTRLSGMKQMEQIASDALKGE